MVKWEVTDNNKLADISNSPYAFGQVWLVGPDERQYFEMKVKADGDGEVGHAVGLTQTLLESTRLATYDNSGTQGYVNQRPSREPPILDGIPGMAPWYDEQSHTTLTDDYITVSITDMPDVKLLSNMYTDSNKQNTASIQELFVNEKFLITLYDQTANSNLYQCIWKYDYKVDSSGKPKDLHVTECEETSGQTPQLGGDVAGQSPRRDYDPAAWKDLNEGRLEQL